MGLYIFLNDGFTEETYQSLLNQYAFFRFRNKKEDFIFQQDGASPNYSNGI